MNPQFPIYIVSKGRYDFARRLTVRALEACQVPFFIIIEEQEYLRYAQVIRPISRILVLDPGYQEAYDTFDDLADQKSKGPGPARNFAWDHSLGRADWHWVMDDNIRDFHRINRNIKTRVSDGTILRCMEDFCLRYSNIGMAGPNYEKFVPRREKIPPYYLNTRIYSCNLIRNDIPFRWRGRYNEDTDLSIRILKAQWCTILFNAFLQEKAWTQRIKGGCTDAFYAKEGTLAKSQMLVNMHPDIARLTKRHGREDGQPNPRDHHQVDYSKFQRTRLKLKDEVTLSPGVDEYGMEIIKIK
jgi:hypothetical protein